MANTINVCSVSEQSNNNDENNIISPSQPRDDSHNGENPQSENTVVSEDGDPNQTPITNEDTINNETDVASNHTESSTVTTNQYKDFSGVDTESFITRTLRDHPKDRALLLSLEEFFQQFIHDDQQTVHQFQAMNSYERMIVHRVAAFFGLNHNIDKNGQSVMVSKTENTRIPDLSFQTFIPADELANGATIDLNLPMENTTRRIPRRNEKNPNQQMFVPAKSSAERSQNPIESRDRTTNQPSNRINRKQQRSSINYCAQQRNIQPSSHLLNTRSQQPSYSPATISYYPQQQTPNSSSMHNYVPFVPAGSSQYGHGIPLAPILVQQSPNGPLQYLYPPSSLPQMPLSMSERQYTPIYQSDFVSSVIDNGHHSYSPSPYVHLYPTPMTHPYLHPSATTFVPTAPCSNMKSIQYTTNQLATLNLQSQYDHSRFLPSNNPINYLGRSLVQSSNGYARMPVYQQYRTIRPSNLTDKPLIPIDNEMKSTVNNNNNNNATNSEQMTMPGSVQRTD